jgi:hypothetical protein
MVLFFLYLGTQVPVRICFWLCKYWLPCCHFLLLLYWRYGCTVEGFYSSVYEMKLIYNRWMIRALLWKCNEVHWKVFLFSFIRKDYINGRINVSVLASCFSFPAKWTKRKMEGILANLKGIKIRGVYRNTDAMCLQQLGCEISGGNFK